MSEVGAELSCDGHSVNGAVPTYASARLGADPTRLNPTCAIGLDESSFAKPHDQAHANQATTVCDVESHQIIVGPALAPRRGPRPVGERPARDPQPDNGATRVRLPAEGKGPEFEGEHRGRESRPAGRRATRVAPHRELRSRGMSQRDARVARDPEAGPLWRHHDSAVWPRSLRSGSRVGDSARGAISVGSHVGDSRPLWWGARPWSGGDDPAQLTSCRRSVGD